MVEGTTKSPTKGANTPLSPANHPLPAFAPSLPLFAPLLPPSLNLKPLESIETDSSPLDSDLNVPKAPLGITAVPLRVPPLPLGADEVLLGPLQSKEEFPDPPVLEKQVELQPLASIVAARELKTTTNDLQVPDRNLQDLAGRLKAEPEPPVVEVHPPLPNSIVDANPDVREHKPLLAELGANQLGSEGVLLPVSLEPEAKPKLNQENN